MDPRGTIGSGNGARSVRVCVCVCGRQHSLAVKDEDSTNKTSLTERTRTIESVLTLQGEAGEHTKAFIPST